MYTGSLAPANFSGAVFTCAHFQKIALISSLCNFNYISEGIPSNLCFCLVSAADLAHADFCQIQKNTGVKDQAEVYILDQKMDLCESLTLVTKHSKSIFSGKNQFA